jgi:hypothetical protein
MLQRQNSIFTRTQDAGPQDQVPNPQSLAKSQSKRDKELDLFLKDQQGSKLLKLINKLAPDSELLSSHRE